MIDERQYLYIYLFVDWSHAWFILSAQKMTGFLWMLSLQCCTPYCGEYRPS